MKTTLFGREDIAAIIHAVDLISRHGAALGVGQTVELESQATNPKDPCGFIDTPAAQLVRARRACR